MTGEHAAIMVGLGIESDSQESSPPSHRWRTYRKLEKARLAGRLVYWRLSERARDC
jgi:hypothetical protein